MSRASLRALDRHLATQNRERVERMKGPAQFGVVYRFRVDSPFMEYTHWEETREALHAWIDSDLSGKDVIIVRFREV